MLKMRPPMQSATLQQNEASNRHQQHNQQQQQQQVQSQQPHTVAAASELGNRQHLQHQHQQQQQRNKSKLQQREILVEKHLNIACSATAAAARIAHNTPTYQQHFARSRSISPVDDDSIRLVDLSHSPPHVINLRQYAETPTNRSSIISDCRYSRSSSSEDDGSDKLLHYSRANSFDDAAENFIINFPADSPLHNRNDCIINLPLSETEPLLTNIEATVADTQRAICLSKNSASLIFTKKEVPTAASRYYTPPAASGTTTTTISSSSSNNNCNLNTRIANPIATQSQQQQQRRHHQSLRAFNERNRRHSKHLPATYHQQQRRSLQLNYNNNLVTTSTCSANNNYCCSSSGSLTGNGKIGGAALHKHHHHHSGLTSPVAASNNTTTAATTRKQHAYSWYAPVYSALEEELEQDSRDSSPIHNLANTKKQHSNHYQHRSASVHNSSAVTDNETVALLETRNHVNIQAQLHAQAAHRDTDRGDGGLQPPRRSHSTALAPNSLALQYPHNGGSSGVGGVGGGIDFSGVAPLNGYDVEGPHAGSLGLAGGPLPRRRRFGNFLMSLVGLRASSGKNSGSSDGTSSTAQQQTAQPPILPPSPEITITRTPSEQNFVVMRDPAGRCQSHAEEHGQQQQQQYRSSDKLANGFMQGSTSSLNVVQQKLWNMVRRDGSAASLHHEKAQSIVQYTGLRKCETVLALTRQSNTLRSPVLGAGPGIVGGGACRAHTGSGIFSASGVEQIRPLNRLRNSVSSVNATCSRCSSLLSLAATGSRYSLNVSGGGAGGFVHTTAACQQQQQQQPHQRQRHFSLNSSSCSNSRSRVEVNDNGSYCSSSAVGPNNAPPRHRSSSSGNCSRKSSAGANSTHSVSSISPPSNMTTATLNSSFTPPSVASAPTTPTTPTAAILDTALTVKDGSAASPTFAPSASQAYPLTLTSLLSMSTAADATRAVAAVTDVTDAATPSMIITTTTATTLKPPLPPLVQHQHFQQAMPPSVARPFQMFTCKLCLIDVETASEATTLLQCGCQFCTECMKAYVDFEISEGAYEISCPDAQCPAQGIITLPETAQLTTANLMKKHHRYRLNREIELDKSRTWCPRAGCETVCLVGPAAQSDSTPSTSASTTTSAAVVMSSPTCDGIAQLLCAVQCPSCKDEFCSACKKTWHPNISCEEHSRRLVADGQDDIGIPFDSDLIKCCPMCAVPIEKDEGCAQMMCKRCKHVFCWYCLASLDDDFLLRHYDKGPCKNKLGHSRASVVWHRAQVIGIFAGFGILLLVASPLLLLAAPCIICCKCRSCSGSKIDEGDGDLDEAAALQS